MHCKIEESCPYSNECLNKSMAECCAYHTNNYADIEDDFRNSNFLTQEKIKENLDDFWPIDGTQNIY